jgi:hypothetical protein
VRESGSNQSGERRIVPATTADEHGHLARRRHVVAKDPGSARDLVEYPAIRGNESVDPFLPEGLGSS